ncbi:hypothetical protein PVAP13_9NG584100 [Panicum virgatum]|uniref:HMA domain-containing protein n=1 Tax=Panicum virgatum TaxID=38727 RepID=A0A8T0MUW5_PANVG|nr:hypothetical protein PVAP13_9NG584100 [Panicum virgatum]
MATGAATAPVQTVVLRVSIHCHGCKKKVRKVLKSVEGVQSVTVDAAQHKVTVTGTVDANTLVQRLHKSGKKGVPWQYCHPPANKTEAAPAPEAAPPAQPAGDGGKDAAAKAADKKPEEAVKEPQVESSEKKQPKQEAAGGVLRAPAAAAANAAVVAVVPVRPVPARGGGAVPPGLLQPARDARVAAADAGLVPHLRRREPQLLQRHVRVRRPAAVPGFRSVAWAGSWGRRRRNRNRDGDLSVVVGRVTCITLFH